MHKRLSPVHTVGIHSLSFLLLATALLSCSDSEQGSRTAVVSKAASDLTRNPVADAPRQAVSPTEALLAAATRGDVETVKLLLEAGVRADVRDADDATALLLAARAGHGDIVARLLDAQANIDATDRHGMTPLMAAASAGHLDVARVLVAAGAGVSAHDRMGLTALMWAEKNGHVQIETLLTPKGLSPENARVARLQRFLIELGHDPGPVDGLYGPQTATAVRDYQRQAQLPITGLVSEELMDHARQSLRERRLAHGQAGHGG